MRDSREGERVGRNVLGDCRSRAHIRAATDADRRDELRIRANEHAVFQHGLVLVDAVVVAGDRAGADVDVRANIGIADVRQVRGLRAFAEDGLFRLDEIADLHVSSEFGAGTQMRVRPDCRLILDDRVFSYGAAFQMNVIADHDVGEMHTGIDHASIADTRVAFECHERIDDRVVSDRNRGVDDDGRGIAECDAGLHQALDDTSLNLTLDGRQLGA